jgi:hypothetical protein
MSDRCPLGEDCDLTTAWMAGQQEMRAHYRQRVELLETHAGLARADADAQRARAEAAEAEVERQMELFKRLADWVEHECGCDLPFDPHTAAD